MEGGVWGVEHHTGSGMPGPHFRRGGAGREEAKARSRKLVQFLKFTVRIVLDLTYHTWIIHRIPPCPSLPVGSWHKAHLLKTHQHF